MPMMQRGRVSIPGVTDETHAAAKPAADEAPAADEDVQTDDALAKLQLRRAAALVQKREYKKKMYRDLYLFVLFYSLFIAIIFMQRSVERAFYVEEALRDIFVNEEFLESDTHVYKSFEAIGEVSEFWEWTLGPFVNGVSQQNEREQGFILRYNRVLGAPRIRQLRVRPDSCAITKQLRQFYGETTGCYALYSDQTKSIAPFGPLLDESRSGMCVAPDSDGGAERVDEPPPSDTSDRESAIESAIEEVASSDRNGVASVNPCRACNRLPGFCYQETVAPALYGRVADWYDGNGYFIDLSYNGDQARQQLEQLRDSGWIDLQTAAVIFTVNVLNPHARMFVNMVFVIEFTPGGGFINSYNFRSFKADLYHTPVDFLRLIMEGIWVVMLAAWILYDIYQIIEVHRSSRSAFVWFIRPWWNFLDVINKAVFVATTAGYIYFWYILDDFKSNITDLNQETDFSQIEVLGSRWVLLFNTVAVNIIISTFTVFKFLNVNPRMSMMWKTLEKATPDLVAFLVFFSIIFFTFVATGYMMFGTQLDNFRTFTKATFACFNMLLGDFQYDVMEREGNKFFAPFFFTFFMVLVTFILVNMFLAIVQDAYVVVVNKYKNRPTLAVALRRWVQKQSEKVRSCVGKTSFGGRRYDSAEIEISNARVRRMLYELGVREGDEMSREEIVRKLPDAPDAHIDYIYNLMGDPDAMRAVYENDGEEEDEEEDGENGAVNVGEAERPKAVPTDPAELLRALLTLESRLDSVERDVVGEQMRRIQLGRATEVDKKGVKRSPAVPDSVRRRRLASDRSFSAAALDVVRSDSTTPPPPRSLAQSVMALGQSAGQSAGQSPRGEGFDLLVEDDQLRGSRQDDDEI